MKFQPTANRLSRGALALLVIVSFLSSRPFPATGQTQSEKVATATAEVLPLAPGRTVERELGGGQTHAYQVKLAAGELLHVTVAQHNIDVAVGLYAPDGKLIIEMNSYGLLWWEELSCVAEAGGAYRVEVRTRAQEAPPGSYTIKLEQPRAATARDRKRIEAERAFVAGFRFDAQRPGETLRAALRSFDE
ncbi:MAG: hypothetical protein ACRD68_10375, partial [Pyrinomonadaceae bacterium]